MEESSLTSEAASQSQISDGTQLSKVNDRSAAYGWNTYAATLFELNPQGLLKGWKLRCALKHRLTKSSYGAIAILIRMPEKVVRSSLGRAERRGLLLDWSFIESLNDEQLERAAYLRLPRTVGKTLSQVQALEAEHLRRIMERR